jgi:uncharacterized metal-binding protein
MFHRLDVHVLSAMMCVALGDKILIGFVVDFATCVDLLALLAATIAAVVIDVIVFVVAVVAALVICRPALIVSISVIPTLSVLCCLHLLVEWTVEWVQAALTMALRRQLNRKRHCR